MMLEIAGGAALAAWVYLLLLRGGFWRMRDTVPETFPPAAAPPRIAIVIPARNEADVIGRALSSLEAQDYPGEFRIVVVDDHSNDGTAEAVRAVGSERVTVIRAAPLEPGWTGKLWAVAEGVRESTRWSPDYLLLTDADIVHDAGNLMSLAARATSGRYDLVSFMATLRCETFAERALIPAFVFFFFLLYPPAWISNPRRRTAGAAGGCILIRREVLERIGGIARIRAELIDDCALARAVKSGGGRIWLGLSLRAKSVREYKSFSEIGRMISRTAFTQLRYSWVLLAATAAGLALTFLVPPAAAMAGRLAGILSWALMCAIYVPVLRFYRRSPFWAPVLPLIAVFYLGATVYSGVSYSRGRGGMWKGRAQAGGK